MNRSEHPIDQPITCVTVFVSDDQEETYTVGNGSVTRIEACVKSGMHADIPYVRVWKGDRCFGEFCQHNIVGVYFGEPQS